MTKEERDTVRSRCVSIDNIIISIEHEINMLRTHLDILTKVCEGGPQTERHLPDYSYEADLGRRIMEQIKRSE